LRAVAAAAEPGAGWPREFRAARAEKDPGKRRAALEKLAESADVQKLPARALTRLASQLEGVGARASAVQLLRRAQQRYPADFWVNHKLGWAFRSARPPNLEEALRFYTAAVALRPDSPGAHYNLGGALKARGRLDEAIASYHRAIDLDPKYAPAHYNLGNALADKGQLDEAIACYRKALAIDPKHTRAQTNVAQALYYKGQLDDAIACCRQALTLDPNLANAHGVLGMALLGKGRSAEARDALARALELFPNSHPLRATASQHLQTCQRLLKLEERLPRLLRGEDKPTSAPEGIDLATLCRHKRLHAAAARFAADAFAADQKRADDLNAGHRYNAACSGTLAAAGQGEDAATLDARERTRLRRQALDWLRADLAAWARLLESGSPASRTSVRDKLRHWQKDSDLASLRDPAALAQLPAEERAAYTKLWADVAALLRQADPPPTSEPRP
jgi:tetratricopeptide (TPR) repeat protein